VSLPHRKISASLGVLCPRYPMRQQHEALLRPPKTVEQSVYGRPLWAQEVCHVGARFVCTAKPRLRLESHYKCQAVRPTTVEHIYQGGGVGLRAGCGSS
jgi:hypothetical protein